MSPWMPARVVLSRRAGGPLSLLLATAPPGGAYARRRRRRLSLIVCGLLFSSVLNASPTTAQSELTSKSEADDTLPLRPADLIRLRVWREPDLSGEFPVNEARVAVLPKLGPVVVMSERAESIRARLVHEVRAILSHSSVEIAFLRRVQIVGAVQKPGLYHVDPTPPIGDMALAGGVSPSGRTDEVEIIREDQKLPGSALGRVLISHSPIRSGDQLYVPERNTTTILAGFGDQRFPLRGHSLIGQT